MDDKTTPAEYVQLRDQLTLDLTAIIDNRAHARRSAEYLLTSGLVPLSTIRSRYEETHTGAEGDGAEASSVVEAKAWAVGEGIEVGAEVEYVGNDRGRTISTWLVGKTGKVRHVSPGNIDFAGFGIGVLPQNLKRVS